MLRADLSANKAMLQAEDARPDARAASQVSDLHPGELCACCRLHRWAKPSHLIDSIQRRQHTPCLEFTSLPPAAVIKAALTALALHLMHILYKPVLRPI